MTYTFIFLCPFFSLFSPTLSMSHTHRSETRKYPLCKFRTWSTNPSKEGKIQRSMSSYSVYFCHIVGGPVGGFLSKYKQGGGGSIINSFRAKFFSRNITMYLQFLSFLHTDMTPVVGILPHVTQGPTNRKTSSISRTKSRNLNVSCLLLQWSLPNPLKPGVKLRMKM